MTDVNIGRYVEIARNDDNVTKDMLLDYIQAHLEGLSIDLDDFVMYFIEPKGDGLTCRPSDIEDFIEAILSKQSSCRVVVDGAIWEVKRG